MVWPDHADVTSVVLEILSVDAQPRRQIVETVMARTGAQPPTVSARLSELVRRGLVVRPERGWYALADRVPSSAPHNGD